VQRQLLIRSFPLSRLFSSWRVNKTTTTDFKTCKKQCTQHLGDACSRLSNCIRVIPCQVIQQNGGSFIRPSPKFTKFYQGKDLRLLSSTNLELFKWDMYFWNYEHLKFWCFSRGLDQKILGILLLELQLNVTLLSLNIFIQYFAVKCKALCWTKQHKVFHWWHLNPG